MGIFRQFPYSNFHEMNLDQIITLMREMQDEWEATKSEWASYKDYIDNYFANLDLSDEVLANLRVLLGEGEFNDIFDPVVTETVTAWLNEHITPTTPAVDKSLSVADAAAEAKTTGVNINSLIAATAQPVITWTFGEVITASGGITTTPTGAHSQMIPVNGGTVVFRRTPATDGDGQTLIIHVSEYNNGTFKQRTSLPYSFNSGNPITVESDTTDIIINFSRSVASGITLTQADIDNYYEVYIYRNPMIESENQNILISHLVTQADAGSVYESLLSNLPANTYVWTNKTWWNDAPRDATNFFYIISLSTQQNHDIMNNVGVQIAIFPQTGAQFVRRKSSGAWTDWTGSFYSSQPVYRAFGDSLTYGAVWDSDPNTAAYRAPVINQIPTRIATAINSSFFYNMGASGARYVKQSESDTATIIGTVIKNIDLTNTNIVTIGGGRNDSAAALGNGDTATANDGTICGALVDILEYLTANYPKLQICVYGVTPQPTSTSHAPEDIFTRVFAGGWSLTTFYEEFKKVCDRFNVPFIDWFKCPLMLQWGVLSGGYSNGTQNWSHPLSEDIYTQMGNYLAGQVASYYIG